MSVISNYLEPKLLIELVSNLATLDREMTIYALEPWTLHSPAVLASPAEDGRIAAAERKVCPHRYFLEVSIAQDLISDWLEQISPKPTISEQCERLIHYAMYDA